MAVLWPNSCCLLTLTHAKPSSRIASHMKGSSGELCWSGAAACLLMHTHAKPHEVLLVECCAGRVVLARHAAASLVPCGEPTNYAVPNAVVVVVVVVLVMPMPWWCGW